MSKKDFVYLPWVPKSPELESFPFEYTIVSKTESETCDTIFEFVMPDKSNAETQKKLLNSEIKNTLINTIDFTMPEKTTYILRVDLYKLSEKKKVFLQSSYLTIKIKNTGYNYVLVKDLEHLKEILSSKKIERISFDTETTGLDPEEDTIVGFSFSLDGKTGYYVPTNHEEQFDEYNLDSYEALKLIYEAMTKAGLSYMFNSRFDMRMMEYTNGVFDMSKVKVRDTQVSAWFADPDFRQHSLKYLEKHFLGYYRPDLSDTLKRSRINTFNLSVISPKKILFYAAQDAISTFMLGKETDKFYDEFKMSAVIDQSLLYPLMKMENHSIRIDTLYLESQLDYIIPRLAEINEALEKEVGNVNFNSPKQRISLFESFGLDTGVKTATGNMATGTAEVEAMIENLEKGGKPYPTWLKVLSERAKLEKMQSTFFNGLLQQSKLSNGRIRLNYRNTTAATGRLSSGADNGE